MIRTVASTVGRFLSRVSYLPSYTSFLRRRRSHFEKPIRLSKEILMLCYSYVFSCTTQSNLCFWRSTFRFISPLIVLVSQNSNTSLLTMLRVVATSFTRNATRAGIGAKKDSCFRRLACCICRSIIRLRSLIGLFNSIIKSDKSGRQAKTI